MGDHICFNECFQFPRPTNQSTHHMGPALKAGEWIQWSTLKQQSDADLTHFSFFSLLLRNAKCCDLERLYFFLLLFSPPTCVMAEF